MLHVVLIRILLVSIAWTGVIVARVLIVWSDIETTVQLRVGALQKVLISHGGRFFGSLLMAGHKIHVVIGILRRFLASLCSALSKSWRRFDCVTFLWGKLWLPLWVGVLMHYQHIVAVTDCMLIWHFARLSCSGGVLLIEDILKLPHSFSLFDTKFLAFLVPAPLIDLSLSQRCLFGYHQEGFLGPMRIFFEFRKQLVKLVCSLSFSFPYQPLHLTCLLIKDISSALLVEAWIQWLVVHRFISCEAHVLSDALFVCFDHLSRVSGDLLVHWLIVDLRFFLVFTFSWCYFLHNLSILRP